MNLLFSAIFMTIVLIGIFKVTYHIYYMIITDARARGLRHPKLWGLFIISGNDSSSLILYLIKRKSHPIIYLSTADRLEIEQRKKSARVGGIFLTIGIIGLLICSSF